MNVCMLLGICGVVVALVSVLWTAQLPYYAPRSRYYAGVTGMVLGLLTFVCSACIDYDRTEINTDEYNELAEFKEDVRLELFDAMLDGKVTKPEFNRLKQLSENSAFRAAKNKVLEVD